MHAARPLAVSVMVAAAAAFCAAPAGAQSICGQPADGATPRATLTLDGTSKTTIAFERDTRPETLNLLFAVTGCQLDPSNTPRPKLEVRPKEGSPELPPAPQAKGPNPPTDVVTIRDVTVEQDSLEVRLAIDSPAAIDEDAYEAFAVLRAPYMVSSRTPIAISRSEDNFLVPLGVGAVFGLLGFLWLVITKAVSKEELTISWWWLIPFGLVAAGFGAAAVVGVWLDQDVWTLSENGKGAAAAGVAGATAGSMLTLITAIWRARTPDRPGGD